MNTTHDKNAYNSTANSSNTYEKKAHSQTDLSQDPRLMHVTTALRDDLTEKIQALSDKIEYKMQQKIIEQTQKPFLPPEDVAHQELVQYKSAFNQFIRTGNDSAIQDMQLKAIEIAGTGAEGGVLVAPHLSDRILATIKDSSPMRSVCKTVRVMGNVAEFIVDPYESGAGWASETMQRSETATSNFKKVSIPIHEIYALPKASQRILDDSAFNIEQWITERVSEKFTRLENAAFTVGDGTNKPHGITSKPIASQGNWEWGSIEAINSGAAAWLSAINPADILLDMIYILKTGYRRNAHFMMNAKTLSTIRKLKDSQGRYLIADGINGDNKEMSLFGYSIIVNEDMDDITANSCPILFGDFSKAYVIVDSYDMRVLRDPYSAKPYVYFYVTKRVGGDVLDYEAVKALRIAV